MPDLSKEQWKGLLKSTKFFEIFDDHEIDKIVNFLRLITFSDAQIYNQRE